jgi:hypothetical protein
VRANLALTQARQVRVELRTHGNVIAFDIAAKFFADDPRQVVVAVNDRRGLQDVVGALERRVAVLTAGRLPRQYCGTSQQEHARPQSFH